MVQCCDLDQHRPTEPALIMVLIHVSLIHYGSHMQLLECEGARRLNFYFISFSTNYFKQLHMISGHPCRKHFLREWRKTLNYKLTLLWGSFMNQKE